MSGQAVISGQVTGVPLGTIQIGPLTVVAQSSNEVYVATYVFASGANTINVPAANWMLIQPDPTNAVSLTLKGITGDTGIPLSKTAPTLISLSASFPSTFILTAGGTFVTTTSITFA